MVERRMEGRLVAVGLWKADQRMLRIDEGPGRRRRPVSITTATTDIVAEGTDSLRRRSFRPLRPPLLPPRW